MTDVTKEVDSEWLNEAIEFLSSKRISSPESFISKVDGIGIDKIY